MDRNDLHELHYITTIRNVPSIMSRGILSHRRARKIDHNSVAMEVIQERREKKTVPGGRPLHEYVNLYINSRNKMLYRVICEGKVRHADLCVLRVKTEILDLPDVVVVDQNAASEYAGFYPAPSGLRKIDRDLVFAEYWTHPNNPIDEWLHGSIMCSEVLVPDRIAPGFIIGAYVSCSDGKATLEAAGVVIPVTINPYLFFR
ncbi:MAG: DUF4433 domain-containing protein [Thermodesulfobacteriota bacterium]